MDEFTAKRVLSIEQKVTQLLRIVVIAVSASAPKLKHVPSLGDAPDVPVYELDYDNGLAIHITHYKPARPSDQAPIILFPGIGVSGMAYHEVAERLRQKGKEVVVVQMPGHGDPTGTYSYYSGFREVPQDMVDDLAPNKNGLTHGIHALVAESCKANFKLLEKVTDSCMPIVNAVWKTRDAVAKSVIEVIPRSGVLTRMLSNLALRPISCLNEMAEHESQRAEPELNRSLETLSEEVKGIAQTVHIDSRNASYYYTSEGFAGYVMDDLIAALRGILGGRKLNFLAHARSAFAMRMFLAGIKLNVTTGTLEVSEETVKSRLSNLSAITFLDAPMDLPSDTKLPIADFAYNALMKESYANIKDYLVSASFLPKAWSRNILWQYDSELLECMDPDYLAATIGRSETWDESLLRQFIEKGRSAILPDLVLAEGIRLVRGPGLGLSMLRGRDDKRIDLTKAYQESFSRIFKHVPVRVMMTELDSGRAGSSDELIKQEFGRWAGSVDSYVSPNSPHIPFVSRQWTQEVFDFLLQI
jgi:hypothetical protein